MNSYSTRCKEEWDNNLFIFKRSFFSGERCEKIKEFVRNIQKYHLFTRTYSLNNYSVNNNKRDQ